MSDRKQIRVTLPAELQQAFDEAKRNAENAVMMKMTDTQYASRLVAWALEQQEGAK